MLTAFIVLEISRLSIAKLISPTWALTLVTILFETSEIRCENEYRLKTSIYPSNYQILITPDFDKFTFDGEVKITLRTSEADQLEITLHSKDLLLSDLEIQKANDKTATKVSVDLYDAEHETVNIKLDQPLAVNTDYQLYIKYTGLIRSELNGFYRSFYIENGVRKVLGATQLQATHARKVFPCFDEPSFKATFDLTIDRPQNYKPSLANTQMEQQTLLDNQMVREKFYTTPVMSTYLVAFLVSEFEAAHYETGNNSQELGVWARPEASNQGQYAFDFAKKVVKELGDYFGIDYYATSQYLKLDHVGLPDFGAGAMENWGLVKYREGYLMFDAEESSPYYEYRIAQIIAHETTHMWFGDLVTCHWWGDGWLNEGFATFFETFITYKISPELATNDIAVTTALHTALNKDQGISSPAISHNDVSTPEEISEHFGVLSYQKPGSVIRMVQHLIGEDVFQEGLQKHLISGSLKAVHPEDLYSSLQTAVDERQALIGYPGVTIENLMTTWIDQSGYPLVHVEVNPDAKTLKISQARFYINQSHESNEIYSVPITYTTSENINFDTTKPKFVLDSKNFGIIDETIQSDSWVIFNVQQTGLYRVNYDETNWRKIANVLKENITTIHHLNRAAIVNDVFALAESGHITYELMFDILDFLSIEENYFVWVPAITGFKSLRSKLNTNANKLQLEKYVTALLHNLEEELGFSEDSSENHIKKRFRQEILDYACNSLGEKTCIDAAIDIYNNFKTNGTRITPSLRPAVYCTALREGDATDYELLLKKMTETNVANEAITLRAALTCTKNKESLEKYLTSILILDDDVRSQDLSTVMDVILSRDYNIENVVNFVESNAHQINKVGMPLQKVLQLLPPVLDGSALDKFETWLVSCAECQTTNLTDVITAIESTRAQIEWNNLNSDNIIQPLMIRSSGFNNKLEIYTLMLSLAALFCLIF